MSPIAILKFQLPEEEGDYKIASRAMGFYCSILEIRKSIRAHEKYDMPMKEAWDEIKEAVWEVDTEDIS